jgi:hypothetical protein
MIVVSLFDGIATARVALERAGIEVTKYYASEIDKYAISITQKHFPETIQIGDVAKIDWESFLAKINNNYHLTRFEPTSKISKLSRSHGACPVECHYKAHTCIISTADAVSLCSSKNKKGDVGNGRFINRW